MPKDLFFRITVDLQACRSVDDLFPIITRAARALAPQTSGTLYLRRAAADAEVQAVGSWGKPAKSEPAFSLNQCHALWLMRTVESSPAYPLCRHACPPRGGNSVCVPLMALGRAAGVLSLKSPACGLAARERGSLRRLATLSALALALAHLQERQALEERALRDSLTGLYNRHYMNDALHREVARAERDQLPFSVALADLDKFKDVNTKFQLTGGDVLLRAIAQFLGKNVRAGDVTCRYGGEEFLLILPRCSLSHARRRAEALRKKVKHLRVPHEGQFLDAVSVSWGVAAFPMHGTTPESLLGAAAEALTRAKKGGRDRVVVAALPNPR